MRHDAKLAGFFLSAVLLACSNRPPLPSPARFDRLNRTDFVCVNTQTLGLESLTNCRLCTPDDLKKAPTPANCKVDATDARFSMFALVTQSARGEVAAINLQSLAVIDSRRDIPGYTYSQVGEFPSGIAVPKKLKTPDGTPIPEPMPDEPIDLERRVAPMLTYITDFGSHDLRVLNTTSLVEPPSGPMSSKLDLQLATPFGDRSLGTLDTQLWPPADSVQLQIVPLVVDTEDGPVPAAPTDVLLAPDEDALFVVVRDLGRLLWFPLVKCDPTDRACHPGLVDARKMVSIDLRGSAGKIEPVATSSDPRPVYKELGCGDATKNRADPPPPVPVNVDTSMLTAGPRPAALALDTDCDRGADPSCKRRLLVADESLPLIHAIDVDAVASGDGTAALLAPIVVGVPTLDVAATPRVPVTADIGNDIATTRYVYAIDATDGSVLVTERGEVLQPSSNPGGRSDRLTLGGAGTTLQSAQRLAVLTPTFLVGTTSSQYIDYSANAMVPTSSNDDACLDSVFTTENPARLRGVFLSVAMSDGTVRVVDIYDRELSPAPRDGRIACRPCPTDKNVPVLVRHETRLATNFVEADGAATAPTITPVPNPLQIHVDASVYPFGSDGSIGTPDAPSLCHLTCADGLFKTFPTADETAVLTLGDEKTEPGCRRVDTANTLPAALICGAQDAWGATDEFWSAEYNGVIPGTIAGGAQAIAPAEADNVSGVAPELFAEGKDFCALGVLGRDDIAAAYPSCEDGAAAGDPSDSISGDQLIVDNTIAGDHLLQMLNGDSSSTLYKKLDAGKIAQCKAAADAMVADTTLRIGFEIRRAYRDRLVLSANMPSAIAKLISFEDLRDCLGRRPWDVEVHTLKSFAVVGTDSGFLHRVRAAADGRCVVDSAGDALSNARARLGCVFRNPKLQFEFRKQSNANPLRANIGLQLQNTNPAVKLTLNVAHAGFSSATVVPAQLRYNDVDRRLYLVDISDRGLVPIPLNPFPPSVDTSTSFQ